MSNRLTLEQLREAVSSDATRRADAQEQTIKELQAKLKETEALAGNLAEQCWSLSRGRKCARCELIDSCAACRLISYSNRILEEHGDDSKST